MNPHTVRPRNKSIKRRLINTLHSYIDKHWDVKNINLYESNDILTDEQVKILRMYFVECKRVVEIAEEFGVATSTIHSTLSAKKGSIMLKLIANYRDDREHISKLTEKQMLDYFQSCKQEDLISAIGQLPESQIRSLYRKIKANET